MQGILFLYIRLLTPWQDRGGYRSLSIYRVLPSRLLRIFVGGGLYESSLPALGGARGDQGPRMTILIIFCNVYDYFFFARFFPGRFSTFSCMPSAMILLFISFILSLMAAARSKSRSFAASLISASSFFKVASSRL